MRVDAGGPNDDTGGDEGNVFRVFENAFENAAEFAATPGEKSGAVRMAVNRFAGGNLIFAGDQLNAVPADEVSFDCVTIGMRTDAAASRVSGKIGRKQRAAARA